MTGSCRCAVRCSATISAARSSSGTCEFVDEHRQARPGTGAGLADGLEKRLQVELLRPEGRRARHSWQRGGRTSVPKLCPPWPTTVLVPPTQVAACPRRSSAGTNPRSSAPARPPCDEIGLQPDIAYPFTRSCMFLRHSCIIPCMTAASSCMFTAPSCMFWASSPASDGQERTGVVAINAACWTLRDRVAFRCDLEERYRRSVPRWNQAGFTS